MTAERCGLGSLLPVSCRGRAEAFARRLQSRLRSLGREEDEGTSGEEQLLGNEWAEDGQASGGWGAAGPASCHSKQPVVSPDTAPDRFFDFDLQDESAPGSPLTEEIGVNPHDGLKHHILRTCSCAQPTPCSCADAAQATCNCSAGESGCFVTSPQTHGDVEDSSSEDGLQYYEPAWDITERISRDTEPSSERHKHRHIADEYLEHINRNKERSYNEYSSRNRPEQLWEEDDEQISRSPDNRHTEHSHEKRHTEFMEQSNENRHTENNGAIKRSTEHEDTEHDNMHIELENRSLEHENRDTECDNGELECENSHVDLEEERHSLHDKYLDNPELNTEQSQRLENNIDHTEVPDITEIRECVEKLCTEIISQAEYEIQLRNTSSNESSPKVVISRVESQEEHVLKDRDEIHTLFDSLNVQQDQTSGSSSQISTPDEDQPRRVQRSSSLKSGKTPPSTPGRKKIVRFADVLGLDLADVRTFMDEVPKVPSSAFWDLEVDKKQEVPAAPSKCLVPMFQQPVSSPDFLDKVRCNKVCLENAFQGDSLSISGVVRVLNIDFHKSVYLRYSLDNWENFADLQCQYVSGSSDGFSDKFSFVLYAHTLDVGQRVEFAIRYSTAGQQFWDSNGGVNYSFQCLNSTISTMQSDQFSLPNSSPENDGWASFY